MQEVVEYLNGLLEPNDTVVLSLSGGPDSMCLLDLLLPFIKSKNIKIVGAHVNHKVRKESSEEEQFVCEYCKNNGVLFELHSIDKYNHKNFHDDARIQRYNFLDDVMKKYKAKYLFTAHHGDDLMETILMRIDRGSNLAGYLGFKKELDVHGYKVIRPLISLSKSEIKEYDDFNNIPYRKDKTNDTDSYKRNRYRHHVLPFLKEENSKIISKYYKFSKELEECDDYINRVIKDKNIIDKDSILVDKFIKEESFIQRKTVEYLIKKIQQDNEFYMTDTLVDEIIKAINSSKPNLNVNLSNGFNGIKEYNLFTIKRQSLQEPYDIMLDEQVKINNWFIETVVTEEQDDNYVFRINSKELTLPIHIRTKKDGDTIKVKNLGTKKVKDIMIDCKIPMAKRKLYPLIVDDGGIIIGIPGLKKSQFAKDKSEKYDIIIKCKEN
jgi:tRNA(Ile)-lysidine synthase